MLSCFFRYNPDEPIQFISVDQATGISPPDHHIEIRRKEKPKYFLMRKKWPYSCGIRDDNKRSRG